MNNLKPIYRYPVAQRALETWELIEESERLISQLQVQKHYNQQLIQQLWNELQEAKNYLRTI